MRINRKAGRRFYLLLCLALFLAALMSLVSGPFSSKRVFAAGQLTVPSSGTVTQLFLSTSLPDVNGNYYDQNDQLVKNHSRFHSGVDIAAASTTDCTKQEGPVYAAAAGTVIFAGYDKSGFGWSVRIDHGQTVSSNGKYVFTLYGHMGTPDVKGKPGISCLAVSNGQQVSAGQLIGYQGASGDATGVHLHWSVLVNPLADSWKGSIWASPDFYTCLALTQGDASPLTGVTADQSGCSTSYNYFDDFSSYPVGQPPAGYLLRGESGAAPAVQQYGGGQVLAFPYVNWQYWDSWVLKDGLVLQAPYTVKAKINYQTAVADRGGLTVAWNDANWDHIDIQPNVYWEDLEIHITYTGPIPASPVVNNLDSASGSLPISVGTDYWLQIAATSSGPGQGQLVVSWSTDGTNFSTIATITGLADVSGLAGMSTAGPNLPETYFTDFQIT